MKRAPRVTSRELESLREQNRVLRSSARPVLQNTSELLREAGSIFLLCDPCGIVMEATGDRAILERANENHLHLGGRWDEDAIGTNAIGTALHTRRPVQIAGVEHFCEEIQRWSCAATPILHPANGALLGVVDISGPAGGDQRHSALLSAALTAQITGALRQSHEQDQRRLLERLLALRRQLGEDGVLLLDRFGGEVFATGNFARLIAPLGEVVELRKRAGSLYSERPDQVVQDLARSLPGAGVELIEEGGTALGLMITLPAPDRRRRARNDPALGLDWIAAGGPGMRRLCEAAERLTASRLPLLIEGETGAGKELMARAIHLADRPERPFELVYCGELTADAMRRDLAGEGRLAALLRAGGTLCLDEPAATPAQAQPLLFQFLEAEGAAQPGGSGGRVISLAASDLAAARSRGEIRSDLFFQLCGARLEVPALRDRPADVARLVRHFADRAVLATDRPALRFTPAVMRRLQDFDWPGNVRQLRNLIEQLSALSLSRLIDLGDLPREITARRPDRPEATLRDSERARILDAIAEAEGNLTTAARKLGIARSTLYLKLDAHGISRPARH
ncbi:sigma-54-dependent Fis family transcriptional regulator [Tropicimonas sp. IMCC34043]|uniref:sigma-54-dependent Fis family transcriptional regulator n=1 Tax=Tropicimonas sp. IMCC34043 TaxID=2248760 RepID=UPI001E5C3099|nr:sigma 54-interacting transcriptional regulator [Tropicimonas sp. IMCC34043]